MSTRKKRSSTAAASSRERPLRKQKLTENSIDSMCRVCMQWSSSPLMVDLFNRMVQDMKLSEVLSRVGAVLISEDDRLPKQCCTRCLKDLERAYELRMLCQDSDRKLRELFSDVEVVIVKEEFGAGDMKEEFDAGEIKEEFDAGEMNEEFDVDERNLQEVVCKPNVDEDIETGLSEDFVQPPKLEFEVDDDVEDWKEMEDDDAALDSDLDDGKNDKESEEPNEQSTKNIESESKYPDVFDEIPAVGFRCCGCKKPVDTFEELRTHSQEAHADKKQSSLQLLQRLQCDICYKVLSHSNALENHKRLGKVNYRCKSCGDLFWNKRRAYTHFKRLHGPNPTNSGPSRICCACSEKFKTDEDLKEHSEAVHLPEKPPPDPNRPFICNICYRNYKSDTDLYAHQTRMIKGSKNHMCVECGKTFKHPGLLRDHEIFHSGEKVFQCPYCPKSYSNRTSHRRHVQEHTMPADKYKCKICDRCFKKAVALEEHVRFHTGERPLQCAYCPSSFARKSCLKVHLLTHTGVKNVQCPLCDKRFGRATERQKHVQFVHYRLKPFPCFFCPKSYPRKDYRKRHMVSAHPKELRDNPVPEIELSGSSWTYNGQNEVSQSQQSSTE